MIKIAFTNQKGGVGKSTCTINCASILASLGYRVLVTDLDPQGNSTQGLGVDNRNLNHSIYDCLVNDEALENIIRISPFDGIDILPADKKLSNAEIEISSRVGRESLLNDRFEEFKSDYDFVLFDLPPNLGLLTVNGLVAAEKIIIPVDVGVFSLSGVNQLITLYKLIKKKLNPQIEILGVLLTKVVSRTKLSKELYGDLQEIFHDKVFNTVIPQSIKIVEAQKEQEPINIYAPENRGTLEYIEFVKEMLSNEQLKGYSKKGYIGRTGRA